MDNATVTTTSVSDDGDGSYSDLTDKWVENLGIATIWGLRQNL